MAKKIGDNIAARVAQNLGLDPNMIKRIVIDLNGGHIPMIHVQAFADSSLINVLEALKDSDVQIVREAPAGTTERPLLTLETREPAPSVTLHTPEEWTRHLNLTEILDPDGWRESSDLGYRPYTDVITKKEYLRRRMMSTVNGFSSAETRDEIESDQG